MSGSCDNPDYDALRVEIGRLLAKLCAIEGSQIAERFRSLEAVEQQGIRFNVMPRLLSDCDEDLFARKGMISQAKRVRNTHRACYWEYLSLLRRHARKLLLARADSMRALRTFDIVWLIRSVISMQSSLIHLRWLGWKHFFRFSVDPLKISRQLDALLIPERRRAEVA